MPTIFLYLKYFLIHLSVHVHSRSYKKNGSVSIRIVESVRRGNKVIQKTIRSLGQHKDHKEIEIIKRAAEDLIVELRNARLPVLPGLENEIYGTFKKNKKINSVVKNSCNRV